MKGSRVRSIVGLVAAAVVLGVFTLSPVAAHFTTNTQHLGNHAWQQVIKKKVFTKKQANNRFLPNKVTYVRGDSIAVATESGTDASVACPAGSFATGGGIAANPTTTFHDFLVMSSHPSNGTGQNAGRTGWHVRVRNNSPDFERNFRVYVICVNAGSTAANYVDGSVPTVATKDAQP